MKKTYWVLLAALYILISSCDGIHNDNMNSYPLRHAILTLRIIIEDDNGANLLNDKTENNFMSNGSDLYAHFRVQHEGKSPLPADWHDYDNPAEPYQYPNYPDFFIKRLAYTDYWEDWTTDNISDDEYTLCVTLHFRWGGPYPLIRDFKQNFKLLIPIEFGDFEPYNFETEFNFSKDDHHFKRKVFVDGVEHTEPVIRLKLPPRRNV